MIFRETNLRGAFIIEIEKLEDNRGFYARTWCKNEFDDHGLCNRFVQINNSLTRRRWTIRGMHFQVHPYEETKLFRCINGAIFDVIIDLRKDSPTYMDWIGVELTADNRKMLYVPQGFAHGFQTLTDNTEILYLVSQFYTPKAERGLRWNDPAINIDWPQKSSIIISDKDNNWPNHIK